MISLPLEIGPVFEPSHIEHLLYQPDRGFCFVILESLLEGAHFPHYFSAGFQRNLLEITWYDAIMSCLTKNGLVARGGPKVPLLTY